MLTAKAMYLKKEKKKCNNILSYVKSGFRSIKFYVKSKTNSFNFVSKRKYIFAILVVIDILSYTNQLCPSVTKEQSDLRKKAEKKSWLISIFNTKKIKKKKGREIMFRRQKIAGNK